MRPKYKYIYLGTKSSYKQTEVVKLQFQRWKRANALNFDSLVVITIEFGSLAKFYLKKQLLFECEY